MGIFLRGAILVSCIFLGIFVLLVYLSNRRSQATKSFFLLGSSIALWLFFYYLAYCQSTKENALVYFRIGYLWILFIPLCFCLFAFKVLNKSIKILLFVLPATFFFAYQLFNSNHLIQGVYRFSWGYYPRANPVLHSLFLVYFFGVFTLGMIQLVFAYLDKSAYFGARHERIKYVLIGSILGSMGSVDFLPNYGVKIIPFGSFFMIAYPIIFAYAIARYRLMDARIALTKFTIFCLVYLVVLGVPFIFGASFKGQLKEIWLDNWWVIPLVLSTFLATVGPFIYLYFDRKAEDRLLSEQRSYQNVLKNASSGMIRIKNLDQLLKVIVHVVTKTVRIEHASIYLYDFESQSYIIKAERGLIKLKEISIKPNSQIIKWIILNRSPLMSEEIYLRLSDDPSNLSLGQIHQEMLRLKASLLVPSFVERKLIGLILLGPKRSRKSYASDDLAVFSVLANQAALAIENAQFYDEIKKTHEQLFQAEKLATIGTMADGLSHQINNRFHALSLISGDSLDILKTLDTAHCDQGIVSAINDVKSGLERIQANVLQGGEVVRGLLKYSRPGEAGFEPVEIRDVIAGAVDMVQYKIKLKEIDFVKNIPDDLSKLRGNLTQLQEVFFNMFDNAFDAIKERQETLKEEGYKGKIEVTASLDEGNLKVVVSDNGMGVKDRDKKSLFTPFFTTKATARKGTGLGLYVIEKIVAAHNGNLTMDSIYQSGTQFTIILPLAGPR